ncbi:hypothetical protein GGF49_001086 [Coemansia sp. RSA 1853]|nr:hypothetical protein LPJ76_000978 [Coemansia sp. RSA 638]KAJ2544600.1 hypothetical protein GGF49_001086 [Coemansia sp. RSA 1853]
MSASSTDMCDIKAGSTLTIEFHEEEDRGSRAIEGKHYGPCIAYLSKMTTDGQPSGWFKIFEQGYDPSSKEWCIDTLNANDGQLDITIPGDIEDGDYLLRGEIIALHLAEKKGGAEFYNNCVQLTISGGTGTAKPDLVEIPGVYAEDDPGIYFNLYDGYDSYSIPGPKVYKAGTVAAVDPKESGKNSNVDPDETTTGDDDKTSSTAGDDDETTTRSRSSNGKASPTGDPKPSPTSNNLPKSSSTAGNTMPTSAPKVPCTRRRRRRGNTDARRQIAEL